MCPDGVSIDPEIHTSNLRSRCGSIGIPGELVAGGEVSSEARYFFCHFTPTPGCVASTPRKLKLATLAGFDPARTCSVPSTSNAGGLWL